MTLLATRTVPQTPILHRQVRENNSKSNVNLPRKPVKVVMMASPTAIKQITDGLLFPMDELSVSDDIDAYLIENKEQMTNRSSNRVSEARPPPPRRTQLNSTNRMHRSSGGAFDGAIVTLVDGESTTVSKPRMDTQWRNPTRPRMDSQWRDVEKKAAPTPKVPAVIPVQPLRSLADVDEVPYWRVTNPVDKPRDMQPWDIAGASKPLKYSKGFAPKHQPKQHMTPHAGPANRTYSRARK